MNILHPLLNPILALFLAPLLPGIINRTKAIVAGRTGQPLFQLYYDLFRLFQKSAVYSLTVSPVFKAGPLVGLACIVMGLTLVPMGGIPSLFGFTGDLVVLAYLMGLARFFTVAAALDTGSAFEGMGASREVQFSVLAEPALLMGLAAISQVGLIRPLTALPTASPLVSLSEMLARLSISVWTGDGTVLLLASAALFIVMLAENCRIPVDDPTTHLELTMIHEVMVLDHSGPD
ncbi:MAG: NADH-quinone oxidoreductase subunit H, partial [Desulfatirhabdiaceae bacterium]